MPVEVKSIRMIYKVYNNRDGGLLFWEKSDAEKYLAEHTLDMVGITEVAVLNAPDTANETLAAQAENERKPGHRYSSMCYNLGLCGRCGNYTCWYNTTESGEGR